MIVNDKNVAELQVWKMENRAQPVDNYNLSTGLSTLSTLPREIQKLKVDKNYSL